MSDHPDIAPKIRLPGPAGFIPPWQDLTTLCRHISIAPSTVEKWVAQGILPPPRKRGGESMWKWSEVDEYLTHGGQQAADIDRIREATRRIVEETPKGNTLVVENELAERTAHEWNGIEALVEATQPRTVFVTDAELIRRLGVPEELGRTLLQDFDANHPTFPKKQELWGDRRYWPAVKAWLDKTCELAMVKRAPRKTTRTKAR